ncbi:MAG: acetate/propionate family kinase, partial [Acidobacteriota bacterium]|nr:acetate/propionate family kinase [Acidobacteriota bacterium]
MRVLVVNAGSSTLKLALLDGEDRTIAASELAGGATRPGDAELRRALDSPLRDADAVGHRIVHGGTRFREAARIDADTEPALRELADLAPLHQARSLDALDAVSQLLPRAPAVACFDTAFHAALPEAAATYALPASW